MPSLTEMPRRLLPEAITACAIILLVLLWPQPPEQPELPLDLDHVATIDSAPAEAAEAHPAADTAQVRTALATAFEAADSAEPESGFAQQLPEIERVVVTLLRHGCDAEAVNRWLGGLPGFQGPVPEEGTTIGGQEFSGAIGKEHPNYALIPLTPKRPGDFALALSFPSVNGPSRFSIISRDAGRWHAAFHVQSDRQIEAYPLALGSGSPLVVVFERHWRADGSEGTLRAWRLTEPEPEEIPLGLAELQDADISTTDSSLTLAAAQFLQHTQDCILCSRRGIGVTVQAGAAPAVSTRELTPWIAVVDSFYGLVINRRATEAKALLTDAALYGRLASGHAAIAEDAGSLERGIGEVTLRLEAGGRRRYVKATSARQADGAWRIVRLQTGGREG